MIQPYTDQNDQEIYPYNYYAIMRYAITDDNGSRELTEVYGAIMGECLFQVINSILKSHPVAILTIWKLTNI